MAASASSCGAKEQTMKSIHYTETCPAKITKLKVKVGSNLTAGQIIAHIQHEEILNETQSNGAASKHLANVLRANSAGLVEKLHVSEGDLVSNGDLILDFSVCSHPTVMKDLCAECGQDLRETNQRTQTAAVAMIHNIPELMVSLEEAQTLGKADEERLLRDRKLVLLVDLDQTLIHTTNDNIPPNVEDVFHFQLHGPNSPWYHTRLRPYTKKFLENIGQLYELHICTFGSRTYAHMIAGFLDEDGRYFSHRILSRDECFSAHSKMANLKALFPCGDQMVVIIDDREDVWNYAPNLIHVRPYHFFQHTGDINAPPGLSKHEADDKEGYDFTKHNAKEDAVEKDETTLESNQSEPKPPEESTPSPEITTENGTNRGEMKALATPSASSDSDEKNKEEKQENNSEVSVEDQTSELKAGGDVENIGGEKSTDKGSKSHEPKPLSETNSSEDSEKIHVNDTDDYLLHLQDILKTIHTAYYEMYDNNLKVKEKSEAVPDMKKVLPYARRKVLENVKVVFSGVVPMNVPHEKSKPFLVAKSLGAVVMDRVTAETTHIIAARLGTAKLTEAKKYPSIHVVTPDWLWSCAERWERVEELLYPLSSDVDLVRRKPPAHCTSPHVHLQLAMASNSKKSAEANAVVYDRVTGKRIFVQSKSDKGKSLAATSSNIQRQFSETETGLSFSSDELAEMDREVEDILDEDDESDSESKSGDLAGDMDVDEEDQDERSERPSRKRKLLETDHGLIIGNVCDSNNPDDDSLSMRFRRGETIPVLDGDDPDDEDSNEPEMDQLEQDEEVADSEWCLAGEALEREFLSGDED